MQVETPVTTPTQPARTGAKTTEFWLSFVVIFLGALISSGLMESDKAMKIAGLVTTVLTSLGYGAMRVVAKKGGQQ